MYPDFLTIPRKELSLRRVSDYLETVRNQCYKPIHFRKDLFEIFPKLYWLYSIDCLPFLERSFEIFPKNGVYLENVNNQCYNPYIFVKIFSRSFQKMAFISKT